LEKVFFCVLCAKRKNISDQELNSGSGTQFRIRNSIPDQELISGSGTQFRIRNSIPDQELISGSGTHFRIRNSFPDPSTRNPYQNQRRINLARKQKLPN